MKSLNGLQDDVTLAPGNNNVTLSTVGKTIFISANGGSSGSSGWSRNGDVIVPGEFPGTLNNEPLELKVGSVRALRLEPTAGAPNFIAGSEDNATTPATDGGRTGSVGRGLVFAHTFHLTLP